MKRNKNLRQQSRVFVPGSYLGDQAAGTGHKAAGWQDPRVLRRQDVKPVGEELAKVFPWMQCIRMDWATTAGTVPNGSSIRFMRPTGDHGFYNNTNRDIHIDEIRIFALPNLPYDTFPQGFTGIGKNSAVKIRTQDVDIIGDWLPTYAINTENNKIASFPNHSGAFTLPTPYYLQRGHTFQAYARNRGASGDPDPTTYDFALSLDGWDPINESPAKLVKEGTLQRDAASDTIFTFDENRDVPLRDAEISHIGIGGSTVTEFGVNPQQYGLIYTYLASIELQFIPPEGPKWHENPDWFPIWGLLDQPGLFYQNVFNNGNTSYTDGIAIHRPKAPYILGPKKEIYVDLLSFGLTHTEDDTGQAEFPIYCAMYGRQGSLA